MGIIARSRQNANRNHAKPERAQRRTFSRLTARLASSSLAPSCRHVGGRKEKPLQGYEIVHFAEEKGRLRARRFQQVFSARKRIARGPLFARKYALGARAFVARSLAR